MTARYDGVVFKPLGHASVRIQTSGGTVIYIDSWKRVIDGSPSDADFVFATHDDFDHYDPAAIQSVSSHNTVIAVYERIDTGDLEREVTPLPYNAETTVDGIAVRTVPAYNRPDGKHVRENGEPYHREGEVIGLVLEIDDISVFYASDTDFLEDHREIDSDVLIPPIGGRPTMNRHEAANMAADLEPDLVLPVHYNTDGIDGIDADAEAFKEEIESAGPRVVLF